MSSTTDTVLGLIASACACDRSRLALDSNLLGLGMDSLVRTSLIAHLEFACDVEFATEHRVALMQAASVADIVTLLSEISDDASS